MKKINNIFIIILFLTICSELFASSPISIHGDWTLSKVKVEKDDLCYIASLPTEKEGTYKKRGEPYITVVRKKGATYDEISLSSGFIYDPEKDIEVSILKRKFPMFSNEEKAWTYDKNDDVEMVKLMKKAAKMYVVSYAKTGVKANDTYSLIGFNEAYSKMIELCK